LKIIFQSFKGYCVLLLMRLVRPRAMRQIVKYANISRNASASEKTIIEGMWDHPYHWVRLSLLVKALNKNQNLSLYSLVKENSSRDVRKSMDFFPVEKRFTIPTTIEESFLKEASEKLSKLSTKNEFLNMEMPFGYPVFRLYDTILKRQLLGTVDIKNEATLTNLAYCLQCLNYYENLFYENKITNIIVSHPTNVEFSTLCWIALEYKVNIFFTNYFHERMTLSKIQSKEDFSLPFDGPNVDDLKKFSKGDMDAISLKGQEYQNLIRKGEASQYVHFDIYKGAREQFTEKSEIAKALKIQDMNKLNVVIFGNCWPDFPNNDGVCYFNDYQEWFYLTLNKVKEIKNVNWIIRSHPAELQYGNKVSTGLLMKDYSAENVFIWPKDLSGNAVESFADCVVTSRGSAGIEYTAIGKRVLVAAPTRYTPFDFVTFAKTLDEYFNYLENIENLGMPSEENIQLAKIYLGLVYTTPDYALNLRFPHGILGQKLWKGVKKFMIENEDALGHEMNLIRDWDKGSIRSFNTFKHFNYYKNHL
jgi:hypothetical protein